MEILFTGITTSWSMQWPDCDSVIMFQIMKLIYIYIYIHCVNSKSSYILKRPMTILRLLSCVIVFDDWVNECFFSQCAAISCREQVTLRWEEDGDIRFVPDGMFKMLAQWSSQSEDISSSSPPLPWFKANYSLLLFLEACLFQLCNYFKGERTQRHLGK